MPYRNPRRGIHAPHTQQTRPVRIDEIGAMELMNAGSIAVLDYNMDDFDFVKYLKFAASDGARIYVRHMHPYHEVPVPAQLAATIKDLQDRHPWIYAHLPANEPNLEFPLSQTGPMYWNDFDVWCKYVWYNVNYYREWTPIRLCYPPLAQDMGGYLDHRTAYNFLESSIRLYVENGDSFSWHSYWNAGDNERLVENEFPEWLRALLPGADTLIHEAGRKVDDPNGVENMASELTTRFGSANAGTLGNSVAKAVALWILGSTDVAFQHQAFVDEAGGRRQVLYDWAWWGP